MRLDLVSCSILFRYCNLLRGENVLKYQLRRHEKPDLYRAHSTLTECSPHEIELFCLFFLFKKGRHSSTKSIAEGEIFCEYSYSGSVRIIMSERA